MLEYAIRSCLEWRTLSYVIIVIIIHLTNFQMHKRYQQPHNYYPMERIPTSYAHSQLHQHHQPNNESIMMLSPRSNKLSLRNTHSTATHNTEKSTTCNSTLGNNQKKSIKNLLIATRGRNHHSECYLNTRYQDIREEIERTSGGSDFTASEPSILDIFLCKIRSENISADQEMENADGCTCQPKCLWTEHWLALCKNPKRYQSILKYNVPSGTSEQIKRDLLRTQPKAKTFQSERYLCMLEDTLMAYAGYDREVGYVQGMNIIASVLIYHASTTSESFSNFVYLMADRRFRDIYLKDFELANRLAESISLTLKTRCNDLYRHIVLIWPISLV